MEELSEAFMSYIDEFRKLDISSKKIEILDSLKELISSIDTIANIDGIKLNFLKEKNFFEINVTDATENEYYEKIFIYIQLLQEILGQYLSFKEPFE